MPSSVHASFQGTAAGISDFVVKRARLDSGCVGHGLYRPGHFVRKLHSPDHDSVDLPSAGVGALACAFAHQNDLSVIALIGIILLIGIVKKNAIMMIDFALEAERKEGKSPEDAIYEACLLRFRPIMMTTMAALLGGVAACVGTGTGSELRRPLGITIVGGLIVSQMLTLYTTPVVYLYMDRMRLRFRKSTGQSNARALPEPT